jgi:uncharacterized protein (DUF58 family)
MIPTPRLAGLVALGAVFWAAAAVERLYIFVALFYLLIVAAVAFFDWWQSASTNDFEVWRVLDERMNLGAPNLVQLQVRYRSGLSHSKSTFPITVRDESPAECLVRLGNSEPVVSEEDVSMIAPVIPQMTVNVAPNRTSSARYWITPSRRGDFTFGNISARFPTRWGLWNLQFRQEAAQQVRVYPDTSSVRQFELRLRQGRLRDLGLHLLKMRGQGTEFESLRDYSTDDEFRNINWKASARQGKLIANNYQIERDQTVLIALDCGRMMTALSRIRHQDALAHPIAMSKLDWTINASVLLAHVAVSMGDAVGLLLFTDKVLQFIPPRKGAAQNNLLIETLYQLQPSMVEPDYRAAYEHLLSRKLRRALVVTFTDIVDPETSSELLTASAALRRRHNPLCITINNQDVLEMAAKTPADVPQVYQKAMATRMLTGRRQALENLRHHGVGVLDIASEHLALETVNRYLELKARAAF